MSNAIKLKKVNIDLDVKHLSVSKIEQSCQEVSDLLRALSHPQRLMIMGNLSKGKKTVTELQEVCDLSQSHLSQSLSRMKSEGLVKSERDGKYQYYSVADERLVQLMSVIQSLFCH